MLILKIGMKVARHFCHMLRRQTSFNHLFQATRLALNDPQVNSLLLHDWQHQDLVTVTKQALHVAHSLATSTSSSSSTSSAAVFVRKRRQPDPTTLNSATVEVLTGCKFHFLIKKNHWWVHVVDWCHVVAAVCSEFERLLQEQAPMEAYTEWIESIVDRWVLQQAQRHRIPLRKSIRQFLLTWMAFANRLLHDLTAQNASGFGSLNDLSCNNNKSPLDFVVMFQNS